jgi:hypothetical protein
MFDRLFNWLIYRHKVQANDIHMIHSGILGDQPRYEVTEWLDENVDSKDWVFNECEGDIYSFDFKNSTDAMAFKLAF